MSSLFALCLPVHLVAFSVAFVYPFWHEPWPHNKFVCTQTPWCMTECRRIRGHCTRRIRYPPIAGSRRMESKINEVLRSSQHPTWLNCMRRLFSLVIAGETSAHIESRRKNAPRGLFLLMHNKFYFWLFYFRYIARLHSTRKKMP